VRIRARDTVLDDWANPIPPHIFIATVSIPPGYGLDQTRVWFLKDQAVS
jgi:hypothetical protein